MNGFRAWHPIKKEWVEDILLDQEGVPYANAVCSYEAMYKVKLIVQQDSGIKDKNRKKIFEGDIVRDSHQGDCKVMVKLVNDVNESLGMGCGWYLTYNDFESYSMLECRSEIYEVIGNIYENLDMKLGFE